MSDLIKFEDLTIDEVSQFVTQERSFTTLELKNLLRECFIHVNQNEVSSFMDEHHEKLGYSFVPGPHRTYFSDKALYEVSYLNRTRYIRAVNGYDAIRLFCLDTPNVQLLCKALLINE